MREFLWKYLIGPIVADAQNTQQLVLNGVTTHSGYNLVNTLVYVSTTLAILLLVYKLFQRNEIKFNSSTAVHTIPFILLGGTLRFLEDASAVPYPYNIILITPLIYFLIATIYIPAVYYLDDKKLAYLGTVLFLPTLLFALLQFQQFRYLYLAATLILSGFLTMSYVWITSEDYSTRPLTLMAFTQLFEGSVSMISNFYGYSPKQLLAKAFNSILGFPGVLVMKIAVLLLALSVVTDLEDEKLRAVALVTIYSIGLGTGFRVFLRVLAGL